jgi:pimeloyl-ACP methyl ester carboxylesterase
MKETIELEARGLTFTTDIAGPEDGALVLLLHGFPQTRHAYRHELPALAEAGFRAAAPDQRGYSPGARPDGIEAYGIEDLVADALAIAEALGQPRFHLVGHDWGGQVAWYTAALHPDRVRTLTVLSRPHPAAFAGAIAKDPDQPKRSRHHRAFQKAEATDQMLADDAATLRSALRDQGVAAPDADAYLATLSNRDALDAALNWYRRAGGSGLAAGELPDIAVPTLYVWGDEDATVGRDAAEATGAHVSGPYRFVALPGIGHFITDQAPDAIAADLIAHLRESHR